MDKCGDLNMHFYKDGDTCICGQIPKEIFFSRVCDCGASRSGARKPVHRPDCSYIAWAEKRNRWIKEHSTEPALNPVPVRTSKYYQDWN